MQVERSPAGATAAAWAAWAVCAGCLVLMAVRLAEGLTALAFPDEAAHVLGGKMLDAGAILYRDFVDSHGPFMFMLAAAFGRLLGWAHPNLVRWINVRFVLGSRASVAMAPSVGRRGAAVALGLFGGVLAAAWLRQGLYLFSFYPIAGTLAGLTLAGFALGSCPGGKEARAQAFVAGLAAACLLATAYSYAPSVLLFGAAGWGLTALDGRRRDALWFVGGPWRWRRKLGGGTAWRGWWPASRGSPVCCCWMRAEWPLFARAALFSPSGLDTAAMRAIPTGL